MACCIIELKDYIEDLPNIGRVSYYRNENGKIVWEKVADCTFELAVFLVILSGCSLVEKTRYELLSDQNRCVTMVSASRRFLIGIVLDEKNLLLSDYTGKTIAERAFDQRIVSMDIYEHQIILAFEDNHIEVYQETAGELNEKYSKEFEDKIVKSELSVSIYEYLLTSDCEMYFYKIVR